MDSQAKEKVGHRMEMEERVARRARLRLSKARFHLSGEGGPRTEDTEDTERKGRGAKHHLNRRLLDISDPSPSQKNLRALRVLRASRPNSKLNYSRGGRR
jgi:hypothetical protein